MDTAHTLILHDDFTVACEASCDCMRVFCNARSSMFKLWKVEEKEVNNLPEEENWEHNLEVCYIFPTNSFPFRMDGCLSKRLEVCLV